MKISVRNLEPTKVKLTVTVDPEEFNPYLDEARKEIAKQVNVPGFRKGHVPGKIIDQRIGFGAVAGEAVNNGVPELYSKALEEKGIRPMAQPEIDVQEVPESAKDETKLKFVATVERRPDIELPALDGMEIEVAKAEVTDEDINNRLEALRQRFGTLVSVDRPAAKGDYANIDLNAEIDGETVDSQEGVSYELGSATMLDGLDEALEGLSAGEETSFEGTLEAGKHEGEKALIKVKVNSVKAEELPELDDDFASEASEFDTLDELKADLNERMVGSDTPLFTYTVTIQNHQAYGYGKYDERPAPVPLSVPVSDGAMEQLSVYMEGVRDSSAMLAALTEYLDSLEEPTVLVFFGDHRPNLGTACTELGLHYNRNASPEETIDTYSVPYVIWSNRAYAAQVDLPARYAALDLPENGRISDNYLGAMVLELIGYSGESAFFDELNALRRELPVYREREASYCLADGVYTGVISEALQDELVRLRKWTYYLLK